MSAIAFDTTASMTRIRFRSRSREAAAFTLAECVFSGTVLAVFACVSLLVFTQMNGFAANARLRTLAMAAAQQQVDLIQTAPWNLGSEVPAVLTIDRPTAIPPAVPPQRTMKPGTFTDENLPLDNDSFNTQAGLSSPYTNLDLQVTATRTTKLTYPTSRTVAAVVKVSYKFRGKDFSVTLSTLRASDTI
jgi:hypothetical protein